MDCKWLTLQQKPEIARLVLSSQVGPEPEAKEVVPFEGVESRSFEAVGWY